MYDGMSVVLAWKFMVPFRNRANALPDTFGIAWYSPGVWMNLVGAVELAWRQYEQSGDLKFLREAYDELYRKLYWTGPQPCFGYPVAPECWDPDYKPWGSMYYNWCGAMTVLLLHRLAGIRYSIPDDTLTVCEHTPADWDTIEVRVPIALRRRTRWATIRTTRRERDGRIEKTVSVRGCPLKHLIIHPWLEDRELLAAEPRPTAAGPRGHAGFAFQDVEDQAISVRLGGATRTVDHGDLPRR